MAQHVAKSLRIFISSPGDVAEERERAREVIEGLRRRYARHAVLEPIFWEDLPLQAGMSFQQGIDLVLSEQSGIDIAVFILWARLGTPLGNVIRKPDQSEYLSGTERELHLMLEARAQSQAANSTGLRPHILCYRRIDNASFDERLRGRGTSEQQELIRQKAMVEAFFEREFNDAETGVNTRAYHRYDRPIAFSQILRRHLIDLLDPMVQRDDATVIWDLDTRGPPYLGLSSFTLEHADVFFGREEETHEARHALKEQARNGCAFLLLSGPSASGKSSLAQAGVVPAIIENELDQQVKGWRSLVVTPSELAPHPITALIARVCAEGVLPELREDLQSSAFIKTLGDDPEQAVALALKPAFDRLTDANGGGQRLILVIDQFEEFFVSTTIKPEDRRTFFDALEALARSGPIWIVATVRADFYEQVQAEPALVRMKSGAGQLDVPPPGADALRRMVEEPAIRAGLAFERTADGNSVADLILRDAAVHPELLPLIEDLLRELYERRGGPDGRLLTLAAYEGLGGSVEAAMQMRAERIFAERDAAEQAVFGRVLELMVTHGQGPEAAGQPGDARLVRQWADLSRFDKNAAERRLIDAFVAARLFTAGSHPETGAPSAAVAHESLLRAWPRAVAWAQENQAFLRTRALVAQRLKDGLPLLDGDPLLSAARDHLARNPEGFTPESIAFISRSVQTAEEARLRAARQRARRRWQAAALSFAALFAIVAVGVGSLVYFTVQRARDAHSAQMLVEARLGMAQRDFAHAEVAAAAALTFRDTAEARQLLLNARSGGVRLVGQSRALTGEAGWSAFSDDGTLAASVLAAPAGAPPVISIIDQKTARESWRIELPAHAGEPDSIAFSAPTGGTRKVAIAWPETGAGDAFHVAVWSLIDGLPAGQGQELDDALGRHVKRVPSMAFSPTAPLLMTSGEDQRLSLWDISTSQPQLLWTQGDVHGTAIHGIAFSRDGQLLASGGGDYMAKIWRVADMVATGLGTDEVEAEPLDPVATLKGHSDSVFSVAFSPDGKRLASGGYDRVIRIWNLEPLETGLQPAPIATLTGHEGTVLQLAFSDDGAFLYSGGKDETVRIWFVDDGRPIVTLRPQVGIVRSIVARHFEDDIRIGGEAGWSVWTIRGGAMATLLWNGGATIGSIAFSPNGDLLAAGGDDGRIRLWDRNFGAPIVLQEDGRALGEADLDESTNGVVFSPDGRWLAAAGEGFVVHVWDRDDGWSPVTPQADASLRHDGPIWGLCFDADNGWLASGNTDENKRIRLWSTEDWHLLLETDELADTPYALACAQQGRLVSGDSRGRITIRDAGTLSVINQTTNVSHGEVNVWSLALDNSAAAILSGNSDGRVHRWVPGDPQSGIAEELSATSEEDSRINPTVNSVSVSRKHGWIAAGGDGPTVEIYDRTLQRVRSLGGHGGTVWWVTFDPAGTRLAYGGIDRVLRIYNLEDMDRVLKTDPPETLYRESVEATGLTMRASDGGVSILRDE
ncbi:MAG: AAA family ATPase [Hyphomonas sp.]